MNTSSTQISEFNILLLRNQYSLGECLILGLRQEIHKMSLDHFVAPEHKEVFLKNKKVHNERGMSKGYGGQIKEIPKPKTE